MNINITEQTRIASGFFKKHDRTFKYVTFVNTHTDCYGEAETIVHSKQGTIIDSFSRTYATRGFITVAEICKKQLNKARWRQS